MVILFDGVSFMDDDGIVIVVYDDFVVFFVLFEDVMGELFVFEVVEGMEGYDVDM